MRRPKKAAPESPNRFRRILRTPIRLPFQTPMRTHFRVLGAAVCSLLALPGAQGVTFPTGKLVLADYTPHHTTRPIGNGLDLWRYDGNASKSSASITRRVSNGDLIGPDGRNQIPASVYPLVGMQSEEDPAYVEYQVLLAKTARIDGFMIEWAYPGKASNLVLRDTANRLGFLLGAIWQADQTQNFRLNPAYPSGATAEQRAAFLADYATQLRQELYDHPSTPRVNGKPLLLFFGFGCPSYAELPQVRSGWGSPMLMARTHLGLPDASAASNFLAGTGLVDGYYPWSSSGAALSEPASTDPELAPLIAANTHDFFYSAENILAYRTRWIGYTKTYASQGFPLRMGGVIPGVDNRPCGGWGTGLLSYIARKNGDTARMQWELYRQERENLDAILVPTWNDWTEGTTIEPSVEHGSLDLAITETGASQFKDLAPDPSGLPLPKRLFDLRKGYARLAKLGFPPDGPKSRLDAVALQIAERQFTHAATALDTEETRLQSLQAGVLTQTTPASHTLLDPPAEKTATASVPAYLTLPTTLDTTLSTRRCDTELTWEWLDTGFSSYRIYTNSSGTAPADAIAEIICSDTGTWKTANIRVHDDNCFVTRDATAIYGGAVLKITGNVTVRNMVIRAVRSDLRASVSIPPQGGTHPANRPLVLSVEAGGTGTVAYQWRRNGNAIPGGTDPTLTLPSPVPPDSGSYDVVVSNAYGTSTSDPAAIQILTPFDLWKTSRALVPGQDTADADPDADGIPNLAEYAAGSDPLSPDQRPETATPMEGGIRLDYFSHADAMDVECIPEWCTDLAGSAWSSEGLAPPVLMGEQNGRRQLRAWFPAPAGTPRMFVRIRIRRL